MFTDNITIPFSNQFHNYGNFSGKFIGSKKIENLKLIDSKGNKVSINTNEKSKNIIIDFWNNNCSICFKKFPILKQLQQEYKNNDNVLVIAVNVYSDKEEINASKELLNQTKNNDLVTYYMAINDAKKFNLIWYPKTIIIKKGKIIFEGHIEILKLLKRFYLK